MLQTNTTMYLYFAGIHSTKMSMYQIKQLTYYNKHSDNIYIYANTP